MCDPSLFWQFLYGLAGLGLYGLGYYVGKVNGIQEADIERLRKIEKATGDFVREFKPEIIEHHGYHHEWNNMCDAYFSAQDKKQ